MHDPIKALLNVPDQDVADRLTEKWTDAKLGELQYVGVTVWKIGTLQREVGVLTRSLEWIGHQHCRSSIFLGFDSHRSLERGCMLDELAGARADCHQFGRSTDHWSQPFAEL